MRIAIIGAGFCGVATAYHLTRNDGVEVHLIDANGIGAGASGVAAGLLHPYPGAHSKLNWRSAEGIAATQHLLIEAEKMLGHPVATHSGMLRTAVRTMQVSDFKLCAEKFPDDIEWNDGDESAKIYPGLLPLPSIFIKSAWSVDSPNYLKGLWLACEARGAILERRSIKTIEELVGYDAIIVAAGASTTEIRELSHLKLLFIKGQVLELKWPEGLPPIPFPMNSQAYLLMNPDGKTCTAGATYERSFTTTEPDKEFAAEDILPKINAFLPIFSNNDIIDCRSGVRAVTPSKRPLIAQITDSCWTVTGMGAKGLLYHALIAEELVKTILKENLL